MNFYNYIDINCNKHFLEKCFWFKIIDLSTNNIRISMNISAFVCALYSGIKQQNKDISSFIVKSDNSNNTSQFLSTELLEETNYNFQNGSMPKVNGVMPYGLLGNRELKYDVSRYLSYQLTGGYYNTDIFSNEEGIKNTIAKHLDNLNDGILADILKQIHIYIDGTYKNIVNDSEISYNQLYLDNSNNHISNLENTYLSPTEINSTYFSDSSYNIYNPNNTNVNDNFVSKIINGIIHNDTNLNNFTDFLNILDNNGIGLYDNSNNWQYIKFKNQHEFNIKISLTNIAKQIHNGLGSSIGGNNIVGDREYLFKFHFKEGI